VRHGESTWNLENKFTGWVDVPLSPKGHKEVVEAGQLIKESGIVPEVAFTSLQKRAIMTLNHVLEEVIINLFLSGALHPGYNQYYFES
jgi:2,3-bisphosphoglycerate-dependent phosphoglycerate mutase